MLIEFIKKTVRHIAATTPVRGTYSSITMVNGTILHGKIAFWIPVLFPDIPDIFYMPGRVQVDSQRK